MIFCTIGRFLLWKLLNSSKMFPWEMFNFKVCVVFLIILSNVFLMSQVYETEQINGNNTRSTAEMKLVRYVQPDVVQVSTPVTLHNVSHLNQVMDLETGHCAKLINMGGTWFCSGFDGNKDVCFDDWIVPAFNTCLVYSFGVGHDITFEQDMTQAWGCSVYLHDPFVNNSENLLEGKHFFSTAGIALKSHTDETGKSFLSYKDALAANGHVNADIHYLKLDVETTEYEVLPDLIKSGILQNVWQLHMEIHTFLPPIEDNWLKNQQDAYDIIRLLEDSGFRRVHTTVNNLLLGYENMNGLPHCCNDVLWINDNKRQAHIIQKERTTPALFS